MSICDSIKKRFIRLSKGQRKVAQFVIDHPNVIAAQVASEVGRQAGVSESTVIRFCYAIDLSGFSELQQQMKDYLMEKNGISPIPHIKRNDTPAHAVMSKDIEVLENTMQKIDCAMFEQVVEQLHNAQQVFVLGVRSAAPTAFWMYNSLSTYRERVHFMVYDERKIAADLTQMNDQSVLFVVGVNEQQEDVMAVVELAKRKGVKVVAITDNVPCPLQEKADYLFTIGTSEKGFIACDVTVVSLLHALVDCMVNSYKDCYEKIRTVNEQAITANLMSLV